MKKSPALLSVILQLASCASPARLPESDGFVAVGSDSLAYQVVGSGPDTVVVLSGGPMLSSRYLRDAMPELAGEHAMLYLEMRGRGASPAVQSTDSLTLETDVDDLERARQHFGLDSLRVIAHHWGSAVLLMHTLKYPGHLARAAVVSPFYIKGQLAFELSRFPHDTIFAARHLVARQERMDTLNPLGYCHQYWGMAFSPIEVTAPTVLRRLAPAACDAAPARLLAREGLQRQLYLTFGSWDWSDSLPQVVAPTLVMQGRGSEPLERAAQLWVERLPQGRYIAMGDAPLFPWIDAEREFSTALGIFFRGGWPESARHITIS